MRRRHRYLAFCAAAVALCLTNGLVTAAEFTVAVDGNDSHPGTPEKPFASLERARNAVHTAERAARSRPNR